MLSGLTQVLMHECRLFYAESARVRRFKWNSGWTNALWTYSSIIVKGGPKWITRFFSNVELKT